jgi:hypothetical protein
VQAELDGGQRFHRNRLTVEERWHVLPPLNSVGRGTPQRYRTRYHLHAGHVSGAVDHRINNDIAFKAH